MPHAGPVMRIPFSSALRVIQVNRQVGMPEYEYEPLDASKREIRLLFIGPSSEPEAELRGALLRQSLDDDDLCPFYALSYVWGQEPAVDSLRIGNDEYLWVQPNLLAALKTFRQRADE